MASVSLKQDPCSYEEKLSRSIGPGMYMLSTPANDDSECGRDIPNDPSLRWQAWGPGFCTPGKSVDVGSELRGLTYKNTKCSADQYNPSKEPSMAIKQGMCQAAGVRKCGTPQESTRLSNPPHTLRATGINRWEWLCHDPQERAIEPFDFFVSNRILVKDNHVPCIETPLEQSNELKTSMNVLGDLNKWVPPQNIGAAAPGNPNGSQTYRSQEWAKAVGN